MQSRTEQRRILAEAARRGELDSLYWYLIVKVPGRRETAGCYPPHRVPVVPVGPDPEESRHYAHLLLELARAGTPGAILRLELTARDVLDASVPGRWYVWGEEPPALDEICPFCGAVTRGKPCNCGGDLPVSPVAILAKPHRKRHIAVAGRVLCGRRLPDYQVHAAPARWRRGWTEAGFCGDCWREYGKAS